MLQDFHPQIDNRVVQFRHVIVATEGHVAPLHRWREAYLRCIRGWLVADVGLGHANERLAEIALRSLRGVEAIGDEVIHRIHASRIVVPSGSHLYWRGLAGESQKPMPARVPGEINEDVDRVCMDAFRKFFIAVPECLAPAVGLGTKALGEVVGTRNPRVTKQLEAFSVVMSKYRREEPADGMGTEIR